MDQKEGEVGRVRLFVGGLSSEISSVDLEERFAPLGTVLSVASPPAKYGSGPHRGFSYVDFLPTSDASLRKLFSAYNGCRWRGGLLRIEVAKEHYVDKLQKEWAAEAEALAAEEAERLRKMNDVRSMPAPKQAKSWPLLLLEQPERPEKWKRKGDFEQSAESDGIKIFFPRLKKVKSVPSKGLGKHKRSFQRVESLPLQQLSTCDCDDSLRTGSCGCSIAQPGDAHDDSVIGGEYDPVSLTIAKERQRQLELLSRLFPSDSSRNSKPGTTSSPRNGAEIKKARPRVDEGARTELTADDSPSAVEASRSQLGNGDDPRELLVSVTKKNSSEGGAKVVRRKAHEPEKAVLPPQKEEESTEIQADEPEMWVSFMETMPLPAKTEENVSEFDLDELSLMLSEGEEEESEEEEETLEPSPEAPKKKARRQKKRGKKSKLVTQTEPAVRFQGVESDAQLKTTGASTSSARDDAEVSPSESKELLTSSRNEVKKAEKSARVLADESKEYEGVSLPAVTADVRPGEPKRLMHRTQTEISESEMENSDDENTDDPSFVDDRDEFFAGTTSSDESFDFSADEGEMWVSGIDEVERAPTYVYPVDVSLRDPYPESKVSGSESVSLLEDEDEEDDEDRSGQDKAEEEPPEAATSEHATDDEGNDEEEEEEEALASAEPDDSMESEGDQPEVWVSGLDPTEDGETSEELGSDDEEEHSELWVSGLESTSTDSKEDPKSKLPILSASNCEAEEEPTEVAAVASTSIKNRGGVSKDKTQEVKPKEENIIKQAAVGPLLTETDEEVPKSSQAIEAPAPKRNELTRAAWKSLVGETGRVVFSLQQVLGANSNYVTPARGEPTALEDTHPEKSGVTEAAQKNDVTSSSPSINEPEEKKQGAMNTVKSSLKFRKDLYEVDVAPPVPLFTDSNVCPFMKSDDAEEEWLATKLDLRTDYRSKHKQAVKKARKLRSR